MTRRSSILDDALKLQGLPVSLIPIGRDKRPALRSWKRFQSQIAEEAEVRDWFAGRDDLGLAVVLGGVSGGLYARDFDHRSAYDRWKDSHKSLARSLPTVITHRGRHVYGRFGAVKNQVFDDGELRSTGCYVIAPHSTHPDGGVYRWAVPIKSLASIPVIDPHEAGFIPAEGNDTDTTESVSVVSVLSVSGIDGLFEGTIPPGYGTRTGRLFELARRIRIHPDYRDVPVADLRPLIQEWHRRALPTIKTKEFSETWSDFVEAHGNVQVNLCGDAAVIAMTRVEAELPAAAWNYDSENIRHLVGLCYYLSKAEPQGVFYLSCRKAAAVLGVPEHKSVARWLQMLVIDGVLGIVEKGGPQTNRATRFRWLKGK